MRGERNLSKNILLHERNSVLWSGQEPDAENRHRLVQHGAHANDQRAPRVVLLN